MKEKWCSLNGLVECGEYYEINEDGEVKNIKTNYILKSYLKNNGYLCVVLYKDGKRKSYYVHRLVAIAFIPNPDNLEQINHKDECKTNNKISNLEWCNSKYNANYGTRNKRCSENSSKKLKGKYTGAKCKRTKFVHCITLNLTFAGTKEAENEIVKLGGKVKRSTIDGCCRGYRSKSAGKINGVKLMWRYATKEEIQNYKERLDINEM